MGIFLRVLTIDGQNPLNQTALILRSSFILLSAVFCT